MVLFYLTGELAAGSSMPVVVMATQTSGSATHDSGAASGGCFGLHKVRLILNLSLTLSWPQGG